MRNYCQRKGPSEVSNDGVKGKGEAVFIGDGIKEAPKGKKHGGGG